VTRRQGWIGLSGLVLATLAAPRESEAAVVWSSGFETNSLGDWDYELNGEGLSVVTEPVAGGQYALRAELTAEREWSNGIFRTEVQYKPADSKATEGKETYFGWSIYLPAALPAGDYQLGYFETRSTYNQVFSLHAEGADLALVLNHEAAQDRYDAPGLLTTGVWHRIVYHVKWSADPTIGFVSLWWDGTKIVDQAKAQTFVDDDPALIQLGLLKNPPEPPAAIVLFIDEAVDGESYADVSLGIAEVGSVAPADSNGVASSSAAVTTSAAATTSGSPASTSGAPGTTANGTSAPAVTSGAPAASASKKSGCSVVSPRGGSRLWCALGAAVVIALGARKRSVRFGR
jgi:hypothetical protein